MRISDWSSDVCSSDLDQRDRAARRLAESGEALLGEVAQGRARKAAGFVRVGAFERRTGDRGVGDDQRVEALVGGDARDVVDIGEIGRASCRERVCQYV